MHQGSWPLCCKVVRLGTVDAPWQVHVDDPYWYRSHGQRSSSMLKLHVPNIVSRAVCPRDYRIHTKGHIFIGQGKTIIGFRTHWCLFDIFFCRIHVVQNDNFYWNYERHKYGIKVKL